MKTFLKNKKAFEEHNQTMEAKLVGAPFEKPINEPTKYPCICVSHILKGVNGFSINYEFVYKEDINKK